MPLAERWWNPVHDKGTVRAENTYSASTSRNGFVFRLI